METKKINPNGNGDKKKAGANNTQSATLKTAGAAIAGAVAATLLANTFHGHPVNEPEHKPEPKPENEAEQQTAVNEAQQITEQQTTEQQTNNSQEDITQPQPTDNGNSGQNEQNGNQNNTNGNNGNQQPSNNSGETPEEIAEKILSEDNIDEEDIDAPNLFTVKEVGTVSNEEGQEVMAALIEDQAGNIFYLADADNDGIFDGVYDQTLAFVQPAESNLTMADIEDMATAGGSYLAINQNDQHQQQTHEDPMNDVIDTNTGSNVNLAQNNQQQSDNEPTGQQAEAEPSVEELLAALLGNDTETEEREAKEEGIIEEEDITDVTDNDYDIDEEEDIADNPEDIADNPIDAL